MDNLITLVERHGFKFQLISDQLKLPLGTVKSVAITYYSHLLAQDVYVPCSVLPDIHLILPARLQQTALLPMHSESWNDRFQPLIIAKGSNYNIPNALNIWHTKIVLSGLELWEAIGRRGVHRSNKLQTCLASVSDKYIRFEYKPLNGRSSYYYTPRWPSATDEQIVQTCKEIINRGDLPPQSQDACRCHELKFVIDAIGNQNLELLKSDVVQAVIKAAHKLSDEALFTQYLTDVCNNLLNHPNRQRWSTTTKLFCASILYRVGHTTYTETLRGKGHDKGTSEFVLANFNFPLPCSKTIKACIPPFVWNTEFTDEQAQSMFDSLVNHSIVSELIDPVISNNNSNSINVTSNSDPTQTGLSNNTLLPEQLPLNTESNQRQNDPDQSQNEPPSQTEKAIITVIQSDATEVTKATVIGKDGGVYHHPDGPKSGDNYAKFLKEKGGVLQREDFASKAIVSIGCDLNGNCTQPLNYHFTASETGDEVTNTCDTIASKLISKGVKKVIHVLDAGAANRSFAASKTVGMSLVHWCYVHLVKNGANHLDNTKYYPIETQERAVLGVINAHHYLDVCSGGRNMIKMVIRKPNRDTSAYIRFLVNSKYHYQVTWSGAAAKVSATSDPGIYLTTDPNNLSITIMRDNLEALADLKILNTGESDIVISADLSIVQAFSKGTLQSIYNDDPNAFRRVASVDTVKWTDKQCEDTAADVCSADFIGHVRKTPGTEALCKYLENMQYYYFYNDREKYLDRNKRVAYRPKYSLDQIIQKVADVKSYLEKWYNQMRDIIQTRASIWVTDIYHACISDNLATLQEIKVLMDTYPNLQLDPHVLSTNRVEGFFGFMRHFSNTFDVYQFLIRFEYTRYELVKALQHKLPFHNRLSRSYRLNPSLTTDKSVLDELVTRKDHEVHLFPNPTTIDKAELKRLVHMNKLFKQSATTRAEYHQRSVNDATRAIQELQHLNISIDQVLVPKALPTVSPPTSSMGRVAASLPQSLFQRSETLSILSGEKLGEKRDKSDKLQYTVYRVNKEMTCQIILNAPLYYPDTSQLKAKLISADPKQQPTPLEVKLSGISTDAINPFVINMKVTPVHLTTNRDVTLVLSNGIECFSSNSIRVQKSCSIKKTSDVSDVKPVLKRARAKSTKPKKHPSKRAKTTIVDDDSSQTNLMMEELLVSSQGSQSQYIQNTQISNSDSVSKSVPSQSRSLPSQLLVNSQQFPSLQNSRSNNDIRYTDAQFTTSRSPFMYCGAPFVGSINPFSVTTHLPSIAKREPMVPLFVAPQSIHTNNAIPQSNHINNMVLRPQLAVQQCAYNTNVDRQNDRYMYK